MTAPKPKQIYDDPDAYWDFVTVATDTAFEGQHFDRKEAGRPEADGTAHKAKLRNVRDQIEECVSAFANATGGLLVLGISSTGAVMGLKHLNEEQLNGLLKFERLANHGCQVRLHDVVNTQAAPDRVALFLVQRGDGPICETVQTSAKAWIRQGPQNVPLSDAARDRLKRDRRVVDFERAFCTRFDAREIDVGVLQEFKDSYLSAASYEWTDEELLYQVGAISREGEPEAWTNAGTLFFSANPQRSCRKRIFACFDSRRRLQLGTSGHRRLTIRASGDPSPSKSAISVPSWPSQPSLRRFSGAIPVADLPTNPNIRRS